MALAGRKPPTDAAARLVSRAADTHWLSSPSRDGKTIWETSPFLLVDRRVGHGRGIVPGARNGPLRASRRTGFAVVGHGEAETRSRFLRLRPSSSSQRWTLTDRGLSEAGCRWHTLLMRSLNPHEHYT
jgi:hypothetical protein